MILSGINVLGLVIYFFAFRNEQRIESVAIREHYFELENKKESRSMCELLVAPDLKYLIWATGITWAGKALHLQISTLWVLLPIQ